MLDFRSTSYDTTHSGISSPRPLPSPRIAHMDGDIPPSMSPLDAIAAQSRLLAKKLDDTSRNGRRVSRLPPLTTAYSLKSTPPGYLQSRPSEAGVTPKASRPSPSDEDSGVVPEVAEPSFRPKSYYPRVSGVLPNDRDADVDLDDEVFVTPAEGAIRTGNAPADDGYFSLPRTQSPEAGATAGDLHSHVPSNHVNHQRDLNTRKPHELPQRDLSSDSSSVRSQRLKTLAPRQSPQLRQAGSIRSIPVDSSDDELSASTNGSSFSLHRKQSSSSGMSLTRSPLSPFVQVHGRSPSLNSEYSLGGSRLARPTYNFSRPISRGSMGRPSLDTSSRQPSFDTRPPFDLNSRQPSSESQPFIFTDETVHTPVSVNNEHFVDAKSHPDAPAPSYIYAKFSLPRGRMLQRDSEPLDIIPTPHAEWEHYTQPSNVRPVTPPFSGHNRSASPAWSQNQSTRPSNDCSGSPPRLSNDNNGQRILRPSNESSRSPHRPSNDDNSRRVLRPPPTPLTNDQDSQSSASVRSGSTIKARPYNDRAMTESRELTAEDHLAKGIESHERGNFKESTYHLRIAAKYNLPTAMLLYALACRHGWGMRRNQQEGVQWLRKAADCASLELADDETQTKDGKPADVLERKTRRAQFALSIYELGVSHMNGWGIEQDKALALRCFEIAANWGDADAMAEAGFCYAQGAGCKKDLKKAAKYYRMAEAKGMSMVGNSW